MSIVPLCFGVSQQIVIKVPSIKFQLIHSIGAAMVHVGRQTDRQTDREEDVYDEAHSRFWKLCEGA